MTMRCRKCREYISRAIDGELSEKKNARLERHLAGCADCRTLSQDLRRIVEGAARLDTPEPSDKVWSHIRTALAHGSAGQTVAGARAFRRPAFWLGAPALRYAGVAAVALAFVVTGLVVGLRPGRAKAPAGLEARERYTLAKLDEAERYYQQAIKSLSEAFAGQRGALPQEVAEIFDRNLSVIDATIQACRKSVLEEPDDLEARSYLLAAYTQKITLLDSALDLQRERRDAAGRKTIL
jgi:hypothetical protein